MGSSSIDKSHGSPWDRGAADCYYGRPKKPHSYYEETRKEADQLTEKEIAQYYAGYEFQDDEGDKKLW